jgi:hypothetical protein
VTDRDEYHDRIIARVWREIEEAKEARYTARPAEAPIPVPQWKSVSPGANITIMEIVPPSTGTLRIHGIASTATINAHNYSVDPEGMEVTSLPVPLLASHDGRGSEPIGDVYHVRRHRSGVYVKACLRRHAAADFAMRKITEAGWSGLSCAMAPGSGRKLSVVDGVTFYDRWTMGEVSICPKGANPDCVFEVLS